jgi:hypothetical protein
LRDEPPASPQSEPTWANDVPSYSIFDFLAGIITDWLATEVEFTNFPPSRVYLGFLKA